MVFPLLRSTLLQWDKWGKQAQEDGKSQGKNWKRLLKKSCLCHSFISYLTDSLPISNHTMLEVGKVLIRSHGSSKRKTCVVQTWFIKGCKTTQAPWHDRMLSSMGRSMCRNHDEAHISQNCFFPPTKLLVSIINPFCMICVPPSRFAVSVIVSLVLSLPHHLSWKGQQSIVHGQEQCCLRKLFFHTHLWYFISPRSACLFAFCTFQQFQSAAFIVYFYLVSMAHKERHSTTSCQVTWKHFFKAFCFKTALFFPCAVPFIPLPNSQVVRFKYWAAMP